MALAEHTKQARVAVILDAAERLIRAEAGTQFSMRALALEAGVSPATPFNLLGSKAKILAALFVRSFSLPGADELDPFDPATHNAIDYAFKFCDRVMKRYEDDAAYYRTLLSGLGTDIESLLAGIANWELVLQVAVDQGDLRRDSPLRSLAETIELGIGGTMGFWMSGDLPSARLAPQSRFAIAATLYVFATERGQARLQKLVKSATRALQGQGPLSAAQSGSRDT